MKKKIDVRDLRVGMYVYELDRPWRETPFPFQGFQIESDEDIGQLKQHCEHVFIDADRSLGTVSPIQAWRAPRPVSAERKTGPEAELQEVVEKTTAHRPRRVYQDQTTVEEEARVIKETHEQAISLVYSVMEDVQRGKVFDVETAKKIVHDMAQSVVRNPDALICFTHLKKRHEYTALHSLRVCILALVFGRHLGFDEDVLNVLGVGALLHDIGKMKVPLEILNKPGKLTEHESRIMRNHVPYGISALEQAKGIPKRAIEVARLHHERYGGTGYMDKLKGDQISEFGLIGAIVDVYDAITSDRPYGHGISTLDALNKMYGWRRTHFHPHLVEQFIQCMGIFPIGSLVRLNSHDIGVVKTMNRAQRLKPQVMLVLKPDKTRHPFRRTVDLARETDGRGRPYEITSALPAGLYGIQPVDYLPVAAMVQPSPASVAHHKKRQR
ncbi:MAG: HD-GYP domain-containing protein [Gammaproteobacteria bacterium]|nr:HD-GYP domain-containing protein [Gammaproteobacteria bacterium]